MLEKLHPKAEFAVAAWLVLAGPALAAEVAFHLVPDHLYEDSQQRARHHLEEGRVHLYRAGSYEPELTVPLNRLRRIPEGTWHWIGEAPGYVTVGTGTLVVSEQSVKATKHIVWPVVPACRIELEAGAAWRGVQRLDVVSLTRGSTYPVSPGERPQLNVPAGPLMAYAVGPRGLVGIRRVVGCRQHETVPALVPEPPPATERDLLVHVEVPEDLATEAREGIELAARRRGSRSAADELPPDATVWSGDRLVAFFLGLSANEELELLARGPGLRTAVEPVEVEGGGARELAPVKMKRLRDLVVRVDYQPLEDHDPAYLRIRYCGRSESGHRLRDNACKELEQKPRLRSGLHSYTFEGLDDGLYMIGARVGDEMLRHLGEGFSLFLDPSDDEDLEPPQAPLIEMELWGHLLDDGEPVPGEVRLVPAKPDWPLRRFPTDEDRLYHLTYFGRPPAFDFPELEGRDLDESLGLYYLYRLAVCDARGACRLYGQDSRIYGGGRLDLELPAARGVEITVLDGRDGTPLTGAEARYWGTGEKLFFDHGDAEILEARPTPAFSRSGTGGVIRIGDLPSGELVVSVHHEGFEPARLDSLVVPEEGFVETTVRLQPEGGGADHDEEGLTLLFPSGVPMADAFLLTLNEEGRRTACSVTTDAKGTARFSEGCPGDGTVVVLHAHAQITVLDASRVRSASELEIQGAPPLPLRVRVVDDEGVPVPRTWVELRYPEVTLGSPEFLLALTRGGPTMLTATDESGFALLRGVDPRAITVPEVAAPGAPEEAAVPLSAYQPGDTVEVVLPRER